jgi:hypothetical protein
MGEGYDGMIDLFLIPFSIAILLFIGAFFTDSEKKGTLIKAFLFILSAGFMSLALYPAQTSYTVSQTWTNATIANVPLNCASGNTIVQPCGTTTEISNTLITTTQQPQPSATLYLGWALVFWWILCILFAIFVIFTEGVTAKQ